MTVLFAIDINSVAAKTTGLTLSKNCPRKFNSVIQGDLLDSLRLDPGGIDVLVFNPPYVPTEEDDSWAGDLGYAWKGGGMGMQTTWKVLDNLQVSILEKCWGGGIRG
jgi:release factor glutamine methyltransferase